MDLFYREDYKMKYCRIKSVKRGNRYLMTLRSGKNGTGKEIYSIYYWPESLESCRDANLYCEKFAKLNGFLAIYNEFDLFTNLTCCTSCKHYSCDSFPDGNERMICSKELDIDNIYTEDQVCTSYEK